MWNIGSISQGTMRPEDLIPIFVDTILSHKPVKRSHRTKACAIRRDMTKRNYYTTEQADHDLEDLFEILGELAPPYFYFGASAGDGSDYGFWLNPDWQQEAFDDGAITPDKVKPGYTGLIVDISDHGNATLLFKGNRQKPRVVWAIV